LIYITGDTHGDISRFTCIHQQYGLTANDMLIVSGDFGCIFGLPVRDKEKLDALANLPFSILFLDGNHECFPKIYTYPEEIWNGGRVHRIRPNVLHLMRGQVFDIDGLSIFTMGGGYSIDKLYRVPGISWWADEMPTEAEYAKAQENLKKHGNAVDILISHAAPDSAMEYFMQTGQISHRYMQEIQLNLFLEEVRQTVRHRQYYFGHMHVDQQISEKMTALYYDVYDLKTGGRVMTKEDRDRSHSLR